MADECFRPIVEVSWTINPDSVFAAAIRHRGVRSIAAEVGVSPQTVSNWLRFGPVGDTHMDALCRLLDWPTPSVSARSAGARDAREIVVSFRDRIRAKDRPGRNGRRLAVHGRDAVGGVE